MATPLNILIVEDSADDAEMVLAQLRRDGFAPAWRRVETEPDFLAELKKLPDIILSDYAMPQFSGLRAAELAQASGLDIPFILISGTVGEELAVKAMKQGATDYLLKDRITRLGQAVKHALEQKRLQAQEKVAEAVLRRSREEFKDLFENAPVGFHEVDTEGRLVRINNTELKMLGYTAEELLGQFVWKLAADEELSRRAALAKLGGELSPPEGFERTFRRKDGSTFPVLIKDRLLKREDGVIVGMRAAIQDITERKRAEAALEYERYLWQTMLDNSPDHIYFKDTQSRFIKSSKAQARQFGVGSPDQLVGKTDFDFFTEAHARPAFEDEQEIIRTGWPIIAKEEREVWQDGRVTWASTTKMPMRDADGNIIGIMGISRDITERKQVENELRWRTAFFEAQVHSAPDGILVVNSQNKILLQNQRLLELFQVPPEIAGNPGDNQLLQHAARQMKHPEEYLARVEHLYAHRDEVGHDEIELADGTILDRYSSPVRDKRGKYYGRIWLFRDITAHRKLEAQFLQAQKMESIGQLAGGIAHDFNNILSAIVGYIYLAHAAAADRPDILAYLEHISKASDRATGLVAQILTFSRQSKTEREPLQLNPIILEALKLLRASVPATINIQANLVETPTVLANATSIHQVIMNLGTNAWHAMHDQPGTLKIELQVLEADEAFVATQHFQPGRYVQLSVSDTGCGMDRATVKRIFDPFFTTKPVGEGTGLGLAVVHGIMKSHDGGISVYSEPGKGTVFHLYFPVMKTQAVVPEKAVSPIPLGQGEHILLVDDEESLTSLGKKMLEGLGYNVTMKTSAIEALAAVREKPDAFNLVITDLSMPAMDGLNLGVEMLQIRPGLPIILMTGYSGSLNVEKVRALGFRELLEKPSTVRTMAETVHRTLHPD